MAPTDKNPPSLLAMLGMASGIGIQFAAAVLLCLGLGYLVDRIAHTTPVFLLLGLVVGIVAGTFSIVRTARRVSK
ncbi:MAG: AtpZ/AtpI family protein [Candidatus Dormibacteraeota bacterium]|nr:AtpZ/AtpI family protein [Candidatus Dormibacteraeota bacterium]